MSSLIIFNLLIIFSASYCSSSPYMAVFLTEDMRTLLKKNFFHSHEHSSPFYGNAHGIYCEHSTIEFNPRSNIMNEYKTHYGHAQTLRILAFSEDEHAQAILVQSIASNHSHISTNQYPHVTISVSNIQPYTPVYSNDLWKRLVDNRIVTIKLDEFDKPQIITLNNDTNEWHGILNRNGKYEETQAYVKIINEVIDLRGIVCLNTLWKNDKCQEH